MTRREALRLAAAVPFLTIGPSGRAWAEGKPKVLTLDLLAKAPGRVVPLDPAASVDKIALRREWSGGVLRSKVTNNGRTAIRIKEVVLAAVEHDLDADTRLYGEGFQMLSQTGGTVGATEKIGNFTDRDHYRLPMPPETETFYGLLTLSPTSGDPVVLAFTSCRRYSGQIYKRPGTLELACDTEGLALAPGESWELEELAFFSGPDREALLDQVATGLNRNHPPLKFPSPPSGWCSWYCFGPSVTSKQVLENLDFIAKNVPGLKYIQIDDGYQPRMGDWLETGTAFGGEVKSVLKEIRTRGFEPAIWVGPFIAEQTSIVFQKNPDWFIQGEDGKPLASSKVTFGGWRSIGSRDHPWYVLDGTHPEVQQHLEHVFRTMREEWGCTYFKLDANTWGAMHGGRLHDPKATRIEAYRRGMEAVLKGAGDAFVLGCNHPIWASVGLVHGSRASNDIKRQWPRVSSVARQNLMRNWQNGRLWWNDPDAVVLTPNRGLDLSDDEFRFHATSIYASGGMMLSGDDLTTIAPARLEMLRKLQPPTGVAARFEDQTVSVGRMDLPGRTAYCLLNFKDERDKLRFRLDGRHKVQDLWTGEDRGTLEGEVVTELPGHAGTVLVCTKV
jgi:alpha-galactosidase